MLVLAKNADIKYASTFHFKFGKNALTLWQTSKWQSNLISYLHLDTLRVHNSLSANYKNSNNQQGARQRHPR